VNASVNIEKRFQELCDAIKARARQAQDSVGKLPAAQLALPSRDAIADSGAENGPESTERAAKTS
jgi:hypothetical protein